MQDRQTFIEGKPLYRLKLIFVGDSGVGKSSTISRFTKNQFNLLSSKTIGIEYSTRDSEALIKDTWSIITIQCWDTVGEQKAQSLSNMFCKNAVGVILVYDTTKKQSFENLQKWYSHVIQRSNQFAVFMVLGNKTDLKYLRTVDSAQAYNWCKEKQILFHEISALNNIDIQSSISDLLQEIIKRIDSQQIRTRDTIIIQHSNNTKDIVHHSCC